MTSRIPKLQLILDYEIFFGVAPPANRISIIKDISKRSILYEIVALNYRLKPKGRVFIDISFETQVKELEYFTQTKELFTRYSRIADKYTKSKEEYPIIFNRQACLFAIEEIINSDEIQNIEDFNMAKIEVWEAILKYILAVNYAITQVKIEESRKKMSFESLNPKLLPLNELSIETDQIITLFRGHELISYLLARSDFSNEIKNYFFEKYDIAPEHFIFHLMRMNLANYDEREEHGFFYQVPDGQQELFDRLSEHFYNEETFKLISIRKSPFIKVGERKYLIADNSFLIEKSYSQFLNDFWFDWIKHVKDGNGKLKYNIQKYRSEFGYFFEKYLTKVIQRIFANYRYSSLLLFDQLKINTGRGAIEIADIYFRHGNRILLGQVKSGNIYDMEKFGGTVDDLYQKDRDAFFLKFGVNQLVESIANMNDHIKKLDPKFPKSHSYVVYPCIIVNDKSFQTALMPDVFNKRFQEMTSEYGIKKVRINPLTLIHISDLELLEESLNGNPKEIWELLEFNFKDRRFIPPFYNTVNYKWNGRKYSQRVLELFNSLMLKFYPDGVERVV